MGRLIAIVLVAGGLIGCRTDFDSFEEFVGLGITAEQVQAYLEGNEIRYRLASCEDFKEQPSVPKIECTQASATSMYVGYVNNGSYLLGMGSSDVRFQIEIDRLGKVVEIYFDEIYTFL